MLIATIICEIDISDIRTLQTKRLKQGLGHRSVNYEVGILRQILKTFRLWHNLSEDVDRLREKHDIGKALLYEDDERIYAACASSRSPTLLPLFVLRLDGGLRASEAKTLRRRDLNLQWQDGVIARGELIVAKSKTDAGTGRKIPLTRRACSVLTLWLSRLPEAHADAFLFPSHQIGFAGDARGPLIYAASADWTEVPLARSTTYFHHAASRKSEQQRRDRSGSCRARKSQNDRALQPHPAEREGSSDRRARKSSIRQSKSGEGGHKIGHSPMVREGLKREKCLILLEPPAGFEPATC